MTMQLLSNINPNIVLFNLQVECSEKVETLDKDPKED